MKILKNSERLKRIYEMLFEMAQSNFACEIAIQNDEHVLDKVSMKLNEVSIELGKIIKEVGPEAHKFIFKTILEPLIIIEDETIIRSFKPYLPTMLGYDSKSFLELDFLKIVAPESQKAYHYLKDNSTNENLHGQKFKMVFIGKVGQELHYYCTIERHNPGNIIIISSISNLFELVQTLKTVEIDDNAKNNIFEVYNYIFNHFDAPLPTTKELAKLFNMNEFQIKNDFRLMFNTSIYQLYTDVRLTYAYSLLQKSNLSLADIAMQSGYSTYLTFYRAFRNKYNCNPTEIKRKTT